MVAEKAGSPALAVARAAAGIGGRQGGRLGGFIAIDSVFLWLSWPFYRFLLCFWVLLQEIIGCYISLNVR